MPRKAFRWGRALRMDVAELTCRGRQEAWKWWERVTGTPCPKLTRSGIRVPVDRFCETAAYRFFEGAVSPETLTVLSRLMPDVCDEGLAAAEATCEGLFDLLGYRALCFGDPIDWHFDPVSGRRAPLVHWSRLDPLDPAEVGDSKVVWELNRHQWYVQLGQAYRLTEDERYAETFAGCIGDWMRTNPPGMGINWASSLEVALRLISWCWALFLFRRSKALCQELFLNVLEAISSHATHVERYLSYYFAPNTHLTGEALGLFYAGTVFPELRRAGHWRELGARILATEIERQILPDGVHFEQSTCYQRYTTETYLHFLILAAQNGVTLPTAVGEQIQRMCDFLLAIRRPDGSSPQIGDADGGSLLPLAKRAPEDLRGIFSTAAAVFGRSDYAWAA